MSALLRVLLRLLRHGLLLALLVSIGAGVFYALYLDQVVRARFEGKRWSLPARVYARPLELYAGRTLTADSLHEELERLNYVRAIRPERPGSYVQQDGRFLLHTRAFQFWDSREPEQTLEVRLDANTVTGLKNVETGADLDLARLDAVLIASIYPAVQEDRVLVRRDELPEALVRVLLAVEDRQFYHHHGIDPVAVLRAVWTNLRAGRLVQGGSTLTQQLVKNFYLSNERSIIRKMNEAVMALTLDLRYAKDQILEAYANEIYLGQDGARAIHGFGLASHFYFNRDLADLDLPQIALLVGLIKGPSYYDPRLHPERARIRRDLVLDALAEQNLVTPEALKAAKQTGLSVGNRGGRPAGLYPAFMDLVRSQLRRDYREEDLRSEGLSIFTTLDPLAQARTEEAIARRLPDLERSKRSEDLETAAVIAASDSGEIIALVGGRRSSYSGFNRALVGGRQMGSLVKPVVYLEALSRGGRYNLATPLQDEPITLKGDGTKPWRPANYDKVAHGRVPLYKALAHSYNLATVHLGLELGIPAVIERLRSLGIERDIPHVPSLLLGALELTPFEITQMYQAIAAGGFLAPLHAVREVLDAQGKPLKRYPLEVKQVADPRAVWLLTWALRQVVEQGTARALPALLPKGLKVAGKTGTTDEYRDSWFAGFTGDKVAVVWVGRDDNQPAGLSGAAGAMRLWGDIIAGSSSQTWDTPAPAGVEMSWIDEGCSGAQRVPFLAGSIPKNRGGCARAEASPEVHTEPQEDNSYLQSLQQ